MSAGSSQSSLSGGGSLEPPQLPEKAITIIRGRLYFAPAWAATLPRDTPRFHFFCTDHKFLYEPFFADFGPLNLSCVCKYARMLERKLEAASAQNRIVVHYASDDPEKRANAVLLMGAAQQVLLGLTAEEAFRPFRTLMPPVASYRDASCGPSLFKLSVLDCLKGLETAMNELVNGRDHVFPACAQLGWFNYKTFDVEAYDFYQKLENGDMNWVIPKKFVAFSCPSAASSSFSVLKTPRETSSCCTPEYYVQVFKHFGVKLVVCLSERLYDPKKFTKRRIHHADLFFVDGTCPSRDIIQNFFDLVENRAHAVAVHCKAGLGRTGTLIGCFAIKNYRFRAAPWIGWNRMCRPGSVLGQQQKFLSDIEHDLMQMGIAENLVRTRPPSPAVDSLAAQLKEDISDCLARLTLEEGLTAENGDPYQGIRLLMAKRRQQAAARLANSTIPAALVTVGSESSPRSSRKILALPTLVPQGVSAAPPFRSVRMGKPGFVVSALAGSRKRAVTNPTGEAATTTTAGRSQMYTT